MNYFLLALKNFAVFSGRARRKEYWMFILFYLIFSIVLTIVDQILGSAFLSLIFSLALLIPSISLTARRLHDTGRSGWWQLIALIPLVGAIVMIVFLVQDSKEDNEHGVNPKGSTEAGITA
ncbi:hypothetical protein A1OO_17365 [Enterovibrio norvegicus FF-33]|uniref:DUF805 domain-containing protein n=2 Tax=Enterovibrio TaxID=188143 RepID=A0A1E5BWY7_9GAMM|nr:DUF805 domain-containing protein [Enterovibrio norvegicus]OEE57745.1 hypothetical protein A1OK_16710 [Enterovibrio norvegicus FF-454]OEE67514.1 hypothetical protein A1OO_17365 [Enterovibrio norvegicus FF-33]OEE87579.1 hypothetical protein A1OQ_14870 [Enterovibrio norvegicus FF-162]